MSEYRVSAEDVCDFCSEPKPTVAFPAVDGFVMADEPGLPEMVSRGDWIACQTCAAMIENERWDDLLMRGVEALGKKYDMPRPMLTQAVKKSHDGFRKHRKIP